MVHALEEQTHNKQTRSPIGKIISSVWRAQLLCSSRERCRNGKRLWRAFPVSSWSTSLFHCGLFWVWPVPDAASVRNVILNSVLSCVLDDVSECKIARLTRLFRWFFPWLPQTKEFLFNCDSEKYTSIRLNLSRLLWVLWLGYSYLKIKSMILAPQIFVSKF